MLALPWQPLQPASVNSENDGGVCGECLEMEKNWKERNGLGGLYPGPGHQVRQHVMMKKASGISRTAGLTAADLYKRTRDLGFEHLGRGTCEDGSKPITSFRYSASTFCHYSRRARFFVYRDDIPTMACLRTCHASANVSFSRSSEDVPLCLFCRQQKREGVRAKTDPSASGDRPSTLPVSPRPTQLGDDVPTHMLIDCHLDTFA